MIIKTIKDFEDQGQENVLQSMVVDKVARDIEIGEKQETDMEQLVETSYKVNSVIQQLIVKENMIMVAQDAKERKDRYIALDVNVNLDMMPQLAGGSGTYGETATV